jgi:predicted ATPase
MSEPAAEDGTSVSPVMPFISRVRLKNYKSIADCDVRLGPLTILVGPNGSGKSNFLDALAFLSRAVATTPAEAIESRGGLREILRRVPERADTFTIAVDITIPAYQPDHPRIDAAYQFEIGSARERGRDFDVIRESCELQSDNQVWRFGVDRGRAQIDLPGQSAEFAVYEPDRLYLLVAGGQVPFAPVFAGLRLMPFFNFVPDIIRSPQSPTTGATLGLRGEHLGDVLSALTVEYRDHKQRVDAYLRSIVPGLVSMDPFHAGQYVTVSMRSTAEGSGEVEFGAESMSDGTVRAAAVLAALFQPWALKGRVRLIGIEEPEVALHPAAAGVLFDALTEASQHVQVLATSQSADLLDREDLDVSIVRPVVMSEGITVIGAVDDGSREIVEKKLYTLGELMRGNQLSPASGEGRV